jgi:riboflavin biosynthesis pyrimidine reductase
MASTADGRASIEGRAGPIGDRADSELLHGLRTIVDGLLVGANTVRVEHYARILRSEDEHELRHRRGLSRELSTYIVSASLDLSPQSVPLLAEPRAPVTIITSSQATLPPCPASVDYMRLERDGDLDLELVLRRLGSERGVKTLLCEGGPSLAAQLLLAGLVDELFLCLAPKLVAGEDCLRILHGPQLDPARPLELLSLHEHESSLFLRYGVRC